VSKFRHSDGSTKVRTPAGFNRLIPGWMLETEAQCHELSQEVRISPRAILSLIELLECSMEGLRFGTAPRGRMLARREDIQCAVANSAGRGSAEGGATGSGADREEG